MTPAALPSHACRTLPACLPAMQGEQFVERFDCVTVLFSDIVSYTQLASSLAPEEVRPRCCAMHASGACGFCVSACQLVCRFAYRVR